MITIWQKAAIISSSLVLSFTVNQLNPVQSATVIYSLSGTIQEGSLKGESISGTFTFDDSLLTGLGYELLDVSQVKFDFLDSTFTKSDADSNPTVEFSNGNFLGLSFSVSSFNPEFSLIPGSSDAINAVFVYSGIDEGGFGIIEYTVIPEPLTIVGTGTALGLGILFKNLKRK